MLWKHQSAVAVPTTWPDTDIWNSQPDTQNREKSWIHPLSVPEHFSFQLPPLEYYLLNRCAMFSPYQLRKFIAHCTTNLSFSPAQEWILLDPGDQTWIFFFPDTSFCFLQANEFYFLILILLFALQVFNQSWGNAAEFENHGTGVWRWNEGCDRIPPPPT